MKKKATTLVFLFVILFSCFSSSKRSADGNNYIDELILAKTTAVDSLFFSQDLVTSFHSGKMTNKLATPIALRNAIRDTLSQFLKTDFEPSDSLLLRDVLQTIEIASFVVSFDAKTSFAIFHVQNTHFGNKYFLYPFIEGKLTSELVPFVWDGQNIQDDEAGFDASFRLVKKPYLQMLDINKDGTKELILQNRNHNGTVWNGVSHYYFSLNQFPKIDPLFYLESRSEVASDKSNPIKRVLELSANGQQAEIRSFTNKKSIGQVTLLKKEKRWEIESAKSNNSKKEILFTSDSGGEKVYLDKLNDFTQHSFGPYSSVYIK